MTMCYDNENDSDNEKLFLHCSKNNVASYNVININEWMNEIIFFQHKQCTIYS